MNETDATPEAADAPPTRTRWWTLGLVAGIGWLLLRAFRLCADKAYAIDEFHYTHEVWLTTVQDEGLLYLVLNGTRFGLAALLHPVVLLAGDDPANMIDLRLAMFGVLVSTLGALAWTCARAVDRARAGTAVAAFLLLALVSRPFLWHAIEIRPDCVALMFVALSVVLLRVDRLPAIPAAVLSGLCLFLACFSSIKAIVYGSAFLPIFLLDLFARRRAGEPILRAPIAFAASFGCALLVLAAVVWWHEALERFWWGFYERPSLHKQHYPSIPWSQNFVPYFTQSAPLWALALVGVIAAVRDALQRAREGEWSFDWLLLGLLFTSWLSFFVQWAAYAYSLLPGIAFLLVFAARGAVETLSVPLASPGGAAPAVRAGLAALVLVLVAKASWDLTPSLRNDRQIELQAKLGELVNVDDTVYDMSATYVFRPRGHELIFVSASERMRYGKRLFDEVPRSLIRNETMLFVYDGRFHGFWRNTPLGAFISRHYQRYNDDLWIWGRRYADLDGDLSDDFHALKPGRYFVHPPEVVQSGQLRIDGEPVREPVFELSRGRHDVTWTAGATRPEAVYVIWLPRNGEVFDPTRPSPPFYLGRYILP